MVFYQAISASFKIICVLFVTLRGHITLQLKSFYPFISNSINVVIYVG